MHCHVMPHLPPTDPFKLSLERHCTNAVEVALHRECVALVKELGAPVEHIVLPTFAVEHKLFVGPFSRAFPSAQVHVAPR